MYLHNGYNQTTNKKVGIESGDPATFKSIDDVMAAYEKQQDYMLGKFLDMYSRTLGWHAYTLPTLIRFPALLWDALEKGKLLQQKGSDHHYSAVAVTSTWQIW